IRFQFRARVESIELSPFLLELYADSESLVERLRRRLAKLQRPLKQRIRAQSRLIADSIYRSESCSCKSRQRDVQLAVALEMDRLDVSEIRADRKTAQHLAFNSHARLIRLWILEVRRD